MVNKAALGVLGVIVLVSMGVGVLIGMQLGNPASADPTDGNGSNGNATPLPGETTNTQTTFPSSPPTETNPDGGPNPTVTVDGRTTVSYRRFDELKIARRVKERINERRKAAGLKELLTSGNTVSDLDRMARSHSIAMADAGQVRHNIDGNSSADRYRAYDLFSSCTFPNEEDTYVIDATGNRLETIGSTVAGRAYGTASNPKFNENEDEVAEDIVSKWWDNPIEGDRLRWVNAQRVGVGVEVTQDGSVYATANLC